MKCTIDGKKLAENLKLLGICQAAQASLVAKKGVITFSASNSGMTIQTRLDVPDLEGSAKFTFNPTILSGLIKNRKNLTFEYLPDQNRVMVSSTDKRSKYSAEFNTLTYEDVEVASPKNSIVIEPETHAELLAAIKQVAVNNVYGDQTTLYYVVEATKTGLMVTCYDDFHVAYRHNNQITGDFSFAIPVKTWNQIRNIIGTNPYNITVDFSKLTIKSDDIFLALPIVQNDKLASANMINEFVKGLPQVKSFIELDTEILKTALDNMKGIFEQEIPVVFSATKEGQITLTLKTNYGELNEKVKVEHTGFVGKSFSCDPTLLNDILLVYPYQQVRLNISDNFVWVDVQDPKDEAIRLVYTLVLL